MKVSKRCYISIYFQNGLSKNRKKRDVTVSFNRDDPLYEICNEMGSSEIKEVIGIYSYNELLQRAKLENRTVSNLIKSELKKYLFLKRPNE